MSLKAHLISWIVHKAARWSLKEMIGLYHLLGWYRSCIVLFYKYYFGKCSVELSELTLPPQVFARNTRLSGRSYAYTVATMSHRTTHYRENPFFTRTARTTYPQTSFLITLIFPFKTRANKHFHLSLSSIQTIHYLFSFKPMQCNALTADIPCAMAFL